MKQNRLSKESSPYLLQHANNPVDWFPWGDEAIAKARDEDKPILVSIGYSACHWCHVMERESFENEETAALMNRHFVNIKIDREERPDLDHIYMEAVQAIAGNGGWPLNVFLTPEAKPFFGGTYFPPVDIQDRPSWSRVLESIAKAFQERRSEINEQADQLTNHIAVSHISISSEASKSSFSKEKCQQVFESFMRTADTKLGGFGAAPKFPQTFSIRFLLQHYYYSKNPDALNQACLSLDKMIQGGIYDQLGGGFARYSTDAQWLAPHFEKMLYDNALLIIAMAEAYQLTQKPIYATAIRETIAFVERELSAPGGGFYSALDADSEGVEGKFYIWQKKEIQDVLGSETDEFSRYYDVTEQGNWEESNILWVGAPGSGSGSEIPEPRLAAWKSRLMAIRARRIRPQLDDKILTGWNTLMISALCKAYSALGNEGYRTLAITSMEFLENSLKGEGENWFHSFKNAKASIPAFLDDYSYTIQALELLQEITGTASYLIRAKSLTEYVIQHFGEQETPYFYYTGIDQDDVIVRKREVYDGAVPSGNAVMAENLLYLGTVFDLQEWKQRAADMTGGLEDVILKHPGSFGVWATVFNALTYQLYEIVLSGEKTEVRHRDFLAKAIPNRVFQVMSDTQSDFPLLRNKEVQGSPKFFLCRDYSCQQPVKEVDELIRLLKNS